MNAMATSALLDKNPLEFKNVFSFNVFTISTNH